MFLRDITLVNTQFKALFNCVQLEVSDVILAGVEVQVLTFHRLVQTLFSLKFNLMFDIFLDSKEHCCGQVFARKSDKTFDLLYLWSKLLLIFVFIFLIFVFSFF